MQRKGAKQSSWMPPTTAFSRARFLIPLRSFLRVQTPIGSSSVKFNAGRVSVHTQRLFVGLVTGP